MKNEPTVESRLSFVDKLVVELDLNPLEVAGYLLGRHHPYLTPEQMACIKSSAERCAAEVMASPAPSHVPSDMGVS